MDQSLSEIPADELARVIKSAEETTKVLLKRMAHYGVPRSRRPLSQYELAKLAQESAPMIMEALRKRPTE